MNPFFHALNTGTLAAWLSVAGAGVAGLLIPDWRVADKPAPETSTVIEWAEPEILLETTPAPEAGPTVPPAPAEVAEPLPAPPEMPEPVAMEPLPDIPDLPAPPPEPAAKPSVPSSKTAPRIARTTPRARRDSPAPGGSNATAGSQTGAANAATTDAARLAAGRMPAPSYPAESRRKNQTGTVVVEFTVDHSGRVIAAFAKSPSPWPLLNDEAVRTVRRWRFPPGGIMHLQRPIVFQLR